MRGPLILLGFLDPTHPYPTVLLTVELGVFPGAWPGGWERKREKEGKTETERVSFVLF